MKTTTPTPEPIDYAKLLADIKARIQAAQTRAVLSVNAEMIRLYWGIGRLLDERQAREGWGAAVIPRLARDLRNDLPEVKGFSVRNFDRTLAFARAYPEPGEFSPQAVAKSTADSLLWQLPWAVSAFMRAMGLVNDHVKGCSVRQSAIGAHAKLVVPGPP